MWNRPHWANLQWGYNLWGKLLGIRGWRNWNQEHNTCWAIAKGRRQRWRCWCGKVVNFDVWRSSSISRNFWQGKCRPKETSFDVNCPFTKCWYVTKTANQKQIVVTFFIATAYFLRKTVKLTRIDGQDATDLKFSREQKRPQVKGFIEE